jgi:DNA-binding transcriptional MocR family regulator
MGSFALSQRKGPQLLVFRLLTLITARYNWQRDHLSVGQREIAKLWDVDERTVKREMAKLRSMGWLTLKRQGVRGRVSEYGLSIQRILEDTEPSWDAVGPDFVRRLNREEEVSSNGVPLGTSKPAPEPDTSDGFEWSLAKSVLHKEDAATYSSWIEALERKERAGGLLTIRAPSRFHATYVHTHLKARILAACKDVDATVRVVAITD